MAHPGGGGDSKPKVWFNLEEKYPQLVADNPSFPACIAQAYSLYETVKDKNNFGDGELKVILEGANAPYKSPTSLMIFYTAEHSSARHTDVYRHSCADYNPGIATASFDNKTDVNAANIELSPSDQAFFIDEEVLIGVTAPAFTFEPGDNSRVRARGMTTTGATVSADVCLEYRENDLEIRQWDLITC